MVALALPARDVSAETFPVLRVVQPLSSVVSDGADRCARSNKYTPATIAAVMTSVVPNSEALPLSIFFADSPGQPAFIQSRTGLEWLQAKGQRIMDVSAETFQVLGVGLLSTK